MQDRFKFRAWDKEHNEMELFEHKCGIQYQFDEFNISSGWDGEDNPTYNRNVNDNYILMQCTGLKDKNGKLIFEGDIVDITTEIEETAIIKWCSDIGRFVIENDAIKADFDNYYGNELEVIGNVYETPELMKEVQGE